MSYYIVYKVNRVSQNARSKQGDTTRNAQGVSPAAGRKGASPSAEPQL